MTDFRGPVLNPAILWPLLPKVLGISLVGLVVLLTVIGNRDNTRKKQPGIDGLYGMEMLAVGGLLLTIFYTPVPLETNTSNIMSSELVMWGPAILTTIFLFAFQLVAN